LLLACTAVVGAGQPSVQLRQPWESPYAGEDATGKHVIALWQFDAGKETEDTSGRGHALKLYGAKIHPEGRSGPCLESFRGHPVEDVRHAAVAKDHPNLTPRGAFTVEMWIKPKPELAEYPDAFLLDKKYVSHDDYQLTLTKADKSGKRGLRMCLGFGADSVSYHSKRFSVETNSWYHIAFTYDGAGVGAFYVNGVPSGGAKHAGRRGINPGTRLLSIGDRIGSYYHGFPGLIDQVRIAHGVLEFRRAAVALRSERHTFVRMEKQAELQLVVTNHQRRPLADATAEISLEGIAPNRVKLPSLAPGQSHTIAYALDTSLRPDAYRLQAELTLPGPEPCKSTASFPLRIVPRRPPHRLLVLMWGIYSPQSVVKEIGRLKQVGFTHVLGLGADYGKIWKEGKPTAPHKPETVAATRKMLDEALANDLTIVASLSPGRYLRTFEKFRRVDRKGKPYEREDICGLFPEMISYCENVGASVARAYADYPAFQAALVHTEVRDSAQVCFHEHDRAAYRKHAGVDIPQEVSTKHGVPYGKLKEFPSSRVIPDDDPIYRYCQWFWKHGDGWCALNSAVCKGLKSTGRSDLWTFHDPAVRVASTYGSGGAVNVLSQWTYSYPDPIRIAIATDELLAMAAGATPPKAVMKMTQIIWYRGQTAPMPKPGADAAACPPRARWELEQPDAPFITIAPMHLREAFWTKIARPIGGIMYHGWPSLVPCATQSGYRLTNVQTQHELARLIREVVEPLGPTLVRVSGDKTDVAFLESFASQMFARRGTYGWGGSWGGDAYLVTLYAHLQPEIVYDETVMGRGLDGFRVLVMCDCDAITQTMADRIRAFQKKGGLIVGDERLTPAIKPDIRLESYKRTGKADADKAALLARAATLRKALDPRYTRYVDTTTPDVIPYRRRYKNTDYVFLVNDRREFGQYVGQHGRVMENGLPADSVLRVGRKTGFVYDLVARRQLAAKAQDGGLSTNVALGPCDGTLLMVTERPIDAVRITAPEEASAGSDVHCRIEVVCPQGMRVDAVVPVEVSIRDPEGRSAEFTGYYGAADGILHIPMHLAVNDTRGTWQIEACELASGRRATHYLRVWPP